MPQQKVSRFSLLRGRSLRIATGLLMLVGAAGYLTYQLQSTPTFIWFSPQNGAEWIRVDRPMRIGIYRNRKSRYTEFRVNVVVKETVSHATLTFRAFQQASVFWDDQLIYVPRQSDGPLSWKQDRLVSFPGSISPGVHELRFSVKNSDGPPAVIAHCEPLGLFTGENWQALRNDGSWSAAFTPRQKRPPPRIAQFPDAHTTLTKMLPLYLVLICLYSVLARQTNRTSPNVSTGKKFFSPSSLRWLLLVAWAVLAVNNNFKTALKIGFDAIQHWEYVLFIVDSQSLPLANDGWQMFQSPLYYLISAITYSLLTLICEIETAIRLTRLIPLLCGMMQVEFCYRALRDMFPKRFDLQCLGLLLGGLLPMNLYLSQTFSNEPMAGAFSAASVVLMLRFLRDTKAARSRKLQIGLGLLLGLAVLSKVTSVLLLPPTILLLAYVLRQAGCNVIDITAAFTRVLITFTVVAGWYYLRNWFELGSPFVGGWDPERGIVWWQDPGYRSLDQLIAFGRALDRPFFAGFDGFWDGLYSSFWLDGSMCVGARGVWNETFMIPASWLALVPTFAILIGASRAVHFSDNSTRAGLLFCVATLGFYLSAMLYLWLKIPFYSAAKATYTLGLLPCYAVLGAVGFDWLTRHRILKPIVYGYMTSWAICAYLAYFVV